MIKPVIVRLTSQSGATVAGYAQRLGKGCSATNKPSGYQIQNGYILKAQRNLKGYTVTVLDTPLFLMLTGDTKTSTTIPNPSTPVGARDSFLYFPALGSPPVTYEAVEDEGNFYVPPAQPEDPVTANTQMLIWAPVQWRGPIFCLGTKRLPFLVTTGFTVIYDNLAAFPFSQTITLTGKMATFQTCALPTATVNELRNTYLGLAHFNVSEEDLPGDWTFHPRRQVAGTVYTQVSDPYRVSRAGRALWQFGVAWSPAGEMEVGADHFCMTSEIYNQLRTTWTLHDGEAYNPPYYDREGEHALGVFLGRLARSTYDPDAAVPLYADLVSQFMVKAVDLPVPDLRPYPADMAEWEGGPSRPNFGYFIDPLVLRTTEGFTVFCSYRHDRVVTPGRRVRAMLVVTPDQTTHVLKADAYPNDQAAVYPSPLGEWYTLDLPGYDAVVRCNPWLVGGFTVDGVDSFGDVTHTAFALVYEHDDSQAAEQLTEFPLPYVNIGQSQWALYSVESGTPTRTVLTEVTPSASVVATNLSALFNYPLTSEGNATIWLPYNSDIAKRQRLCNFANAGNGLAVTASIDKPFPMIAWSGGTEDRSQLTPHDVKCAVVNLLDGTIEQRGTIFVRDRIYTWCFITVAQPYDPGDPDAGIPETQPVLVASTHETTTSPFATGKCWLSVDGGWTWEEYVTDVGAQMGAHLVGNKLFEYDPLKPFL